MRKLLLFLILIASISAGYAQSDSIDHWETVYPWEYPVKYLEGTEPPPENWNALGFVDDEWSDFINIFGYGEQMDFMLGEDSGLELSQTTTFYTRTSFIVADSTKVEQLMLAINCEDAYVAYLNGVEISRRNIGLPGEVTSFDQYADTSHHYAFRFDFLPEFEMGDVFTNDDIKDLLVTGENVLALEIHNDEIDKNSHHYYAWLFAGINNSEIQFEGNTENGYRTIYMLFPFYTELDSTKLPIVEIDIPDTSFIPIDDKLTGTLRIIDNPNSDYNFRSDTTFNYNGYMGIELRGSSSLQFPKKSYSMETRDSLGENNNVEILGMPVENDWVLYAPYSDKTMMRNVLAYKLSRDMGHYSPRTRYVELVKNNDFRGTYVMVEKIKRDNDRIDIAGLRADEIAGDSLTGGYIIKIDKTEQIDNYDGWQSNFGSFENDNKKTFFQYVYPKRDDIQEEQEAYIQDFINTFELSLREDNFDDMNNGYRQYIDVESFVDYFIINELSKNMDGYRLSTYLYKDRDDNDGKLHIGPVWDYNLAFGNYQNFTGTETDGWVIDFGSINPGDNYQLPFWWNRFFQDEQFAVQVENRWNELRLTHLSNASLMADIDSLQNYISESVEMNSRVWRGLNTEFVWPNAPFADNYTGEVEYMKDWLTGRLEWLDANMGETRERMSYTSIESPLAQEYIGIGAYPNPFSYEMTFSIELESIHTIQIQIFNINGQSIYTLANESLGSGLHTIVWSGESAQGGFAPSGVYFYQVMVDGKLLKTDKIIKQ